MTDNEQHDPQPKQIGNVIIDVLGVVWQIPIYIGPPARLEPDDEDDEEKQRECL